MPTARPAAIPCAVAGCCSTPLTPSPAPSCLCSLLLSWQWSRKTGRLRGQCCSSSLTCGRWSACPGPSGWLSRIALTRHGRPSCERPCLHCSSDVSCAAHGRPLCICPSLHCSFGESSTVHGWPSGEHPGVHCSFGLSSTVHWMRPRPALAVKSLSSQPAVSA